MLLRLAECITSRQVHFFFKFCVQGIPAKLNWRQCVDPYAVQSQIDRPWNPGSASLGWLPLCRESENPTLPSNPGKKYSYKLHCELFCEKLPSLSSLRCSVVTFGSEGLVEIGRCRAEVGISDYRPATRDFINSTDPKLSGAKLVDQFISWANSLTLW